MQTLTKNCKGSLPEKAPAARYVSRGFIAALIFLFLVNLLLAPNNSAHNRRNLNEVLAQAQQEKRAGVSSKHSWPWWLTRQYLQTEKAPDVVVFGSSLLGSAHASIDARCLQQEVDVLTQRRMVFLEKELAKRIGHDLSIFSLGSPGEMIPDYYVTAKALLTEGKKPALVVATVAPRDFIDASLAYPAMTDHYKFFSNYVDLTDLNSFAYPDFIDGLGAELEHLPLKRLSKIALARHAERTWTEWVQSEASCIEPGNSVVPPYAVPAPVDNTKEYVERFKKPFGQNYGCQMKFFQRFLADLKKQGIAVTIICMPTTESNRQLLSEKFWQRFRADLGTACRKESADWLDLSDSGLFKQCDYLDTVHLNAYGAVKLFPVIAERLSSNASSARALKPASQTGTK